MVIQPIQPVSPDWSAWKSGDRFTHSDLNFLRMRDAHAHFVIDTLTDDAFARGFVLSPDNADKDKIIQKHCRRAAKWARTFGFGITAKMDDGGIDSFAPFTVEGGGINGFDPAPTNRPLNFKVQLSTRSPEVTVIPIENCVIFTNGDETRAWQGYSELGATIDEYILKRSWRGAALERAHAYARVVHLLMANKDMVSAQEIEQIKTSFPHGDVAVVTGEWKHERIGGNLEAGEFDRVMEDSLAAMAVGAGITKSDMEGAEAGQKLSTDSNQHHFFAEIRSIQDTFYPACRDTYKLFGITCERFEDPWTMPKVEKIKLMLEISRLLAMESLPPEVRSILSHQLETLQ